VPQWLYLLGWNESAVGDTENDRNVPQQLLYLLRRSLCGLKLERAW
jgi:hypothetical protein